ncbi:tRNA(Ile)-lysidine synthase [uncultured Desulfobacterium sp.]|uniref:tRNA(Ile)-lysidine synthase n=1 Tax=uncultured Desulfobacterium sp. TaxID=201089 RepID=A0A445N3G5_9BACT|nr:tRNA(Ile)-lysidine synthase [uncultured Desulfobacterium sp.]
MTEIIAKVKKTISRFDMIRPKDRVVVAVSGGADSVCLLDILNRIKDDFEITLFVAHFDHGLRPAEDDEETAFVEALAGALDIPFVTQKAGLDISEGDGPLEERARAARYRFFDQVMDEFSAQRIAVGHTLNDQAETVIMRLMRGSGTTGLSAIPPVRDGRIIRPLIETGRKEIVRYLEKRGLKFVTDSSNLKTKYLRNRIRLELLPRLMEIQPRIIELLGQTAEIMRIEDQWMEAEAEKWLKESSHFVDFNEVVIPLSLFRNIPEALQQRVIRHALAKAAGNIRRISLRHIKAVNGIALGTRSCAALNLPKGLTITKSYDSLIFKTGDEKEEKGFCYTLDGPGRFFLNELDSSIILEETEEIMQPVKQVSLMTAFLDADLIKYPLTVRNLRPGDRFIPLGMSGHKKLKNFFIDLKIPANQRRRIPILTIDDTPIWICGYRIDDRYRVKSETGKVLKVTLNRQEPF